MKHEHNHHHDGEPCSCGHDHSEHHKSHDHHAKESCACGHDHDAHKDHQHHHDKPGQTDIAITHHENALIVSVEREISGDYNHVKETLALGLEELANWVEDQNGLVGHIKAHLSEKGSSAMLSTTGDAVQIKETSNPGILINLAVIVFVENEAGLTDQVDRLLKRLPGSREVG